MCYEMKCITRVSSKFNPQLIVGKYGTISTCSARMIRENLTRLYHVFAETWNYRILFYSESDYINQCKIVNQFGVEFTDSKVVLDYTVPVF